MSLRETLSNYSRFCKRLSRAPFQFATDSGSGRKGETSRCPGTFPAFLRSVSVPYVHLQPDAAVGRRRFPSVFVFAEHFQVHAIRLFRAVGQAASQPEGVFFAQAGLGEQPQASGQGIQQAAEPPADFGVQLQGVTARLLQVRVGAAPPGRPRNFLHGRLRGSCPSRHSGSCPFPERSPGRNRV